MHGRAKTTKPRRKTWSTKRPAGWLSDIRAKADALRTQAFRRVYPEPEFHRTNIGIIRRQRERLERAISLRDLLDRTRQSAALGA